MTDGGKSEVLTQERLLVDFVNTAGIGLHWVGADGTILDAVRPDQFQRPVR